MTRNRSRLLFGLLLSVGFIVAGVSFLFKIPAFRQTPAPPDGWQIIRTPGDVHALAEFGNEIWAGGSEGLFRVNRLDGSWSEENSPDLPFVYVRALLADEANQTLWVGHQNGLSAYSNGLWQTYTHKDGLPDAWVNALMLDSAGRLWVGTNSGVAIHESTGWRILTQADGLLGDMVNVILEDRIGGIWLGSYIAPRGGISYLKNDIWQYYTIENGLPHNNITSLIETSDGYLWAGCGLNDRGGAVRFSFDGENWEIDRSLNKNDGLAGEKVRSLFEDLGIIWFGSEYDGLALSDGHAWRTLTLEDGLSDLEIKAIKQDSDGNIWLGTRNGITRINQNALKLLYDQLENIP